MTPDLLPTDWDRADYPQSNCPHCGQFASRAHGKYSHWIMTCGHDPLKEAP